MAVVAWKLDLQLPMKSGPGVVSLNLEPGEVYNIM